MEVRGRHEGSTCKQVRIVKGTAQALDGPDPGSKILRIEDENNPAFWLEVYLSYSDIVALSDSPLLPGQETDFLQNFDKRVQEVLK